MSKTEAKVENVLNPHSYRTTDQSYFKTHTRKLADVNQH